MGGRLNIYRGHGLVIAGEGYTSRIGILTVDLCGPGPRRTEGRDNDSAAIPRRNSRGPWFCKRKQTTRSIDADGHWQSSIAIDGLKEFYWAEVGGVAGMGLRPIASELSHSARDGLRLPRWGLIRVCHIKPP